VFRYPEADAPYDAAQNADADDVVAEWLVTVLGEPPAWDAGRDYRPESVAVYYAVRRTFSFADAEAYATAQCDGGATSASTEDDDDAEEPSYYLEVHPAASLRDVLTHGDFVLTGAVRFEVRPTDSVAHATWRRTALVRPLLHLSG